MKVWIKYCKWRIHTLHSFAALGLPFSFMHLKDPSPPFPMSVGFKFIAALMGGQERNSFCIGYDPFTVYLTKGNGVAQVELKDILMASRVFTSFL